MKIKALISAPMTCRDGQKLGSDAGAIGLEGHTQEKTGKDR